MTLPEVNQHRREANERFEAFVRLAKPHGYPPELHEFLKEILDQMTPLAHLLVAVHRRCPAGFRRNDNYAATINLRLLRQSR